MIVGEYMDKYRTFYNVKQENGETIIEKKVYDAGSGTIRDISVCSKNMVNSQKRKKGKVQRIYKRA